MKFAVIENNIVIDIIDDDGEQKNGKWEPKAKKQNGSKRAVANTQVNKGDRWDAGKGKFYRKLTKAQP